VHIYIFHPKLKRWMFFKSFSYLYEMVRTNFSADFWTFRNLWPQFRENCGAT